MPTSPTRPGSPQSAEQPLGLGSHSVALLTAVVTFAMLIGAADNSIAANTIVNQTVAEVLVLLAVGFTAATGIRNTETRLRRLGQHRHWRRATVGYLTATVGLMAAAPVAMVLVLRRWDGSGRVLSVLARSSGRSGFEAVTIESAFDGLVFAMSAAATCALVPWLVSAGRKQVSPPVRVMLTLIVAATILVIRSYGPGSGVLPIEAIVVGAAIAMVPQNVLHRHPPNRLTWPAAAVTVVVVFAPSGNPGLQLVAAVGGAVAFSLLLASGRLHLLSLPRPLASRWLPTPALDNLAPVLPGAIIWQPVFTSIVVEQASIGGADLSSWWVWAIAVLTSLVLAMAAAVTCHRNLVRPTLTWMAAHSIQWATFRSTGYKTTERPHWDDLAAESIGRPLPPLPSVPIRASRIVYGRRSESYQARTASLGRDPQRPTYRDQLPGPKRRTSTDGTPKPVSEPAGHLVLPELLPDTL